MAKKKVRGQLTKVKAPPARHDKLTVHHLILTNDPIHKPPLIGSPFSILKLLMGPPVLLKIR